MSTFTRAVVRSLAITRYHLGRQGTNTGTASTSITADASFGGPNGARGLARGNWVMMTSGGRVGDIVKINSLPKETTGLMNVDPSFGGSLANTETFDILFEPLCFSAGQGDYSLHAAITAALARFPWERKTLPITSVPDGDMLKTTYTTDWDNDQSGAPTVAKGTSTFANYGLRILTVNGNSGVYTGSAALPVEGGQSYYTEITAYNTAASKTGTLVIRDVTNSTSFSLSESSIARVEPQILSNIIVPVASCEQIRLRLQSGAASTTTAWANAIVRKNEARQFVLQDRPVDILKMGRLLATSEMTWARRNFSGYDEVPHDVNMLEAGMWEYQSHVPLSGRSVWYEEYTVPADFAGATEALKDEATTSIPAHHLAAVAAERLLFPLRRDKKWGPIYEDAARDAAQTLGQYQELHRAVNRQQSVHYQARV